MLRVRISAGSREGFEEEDDGGMERKLREEGKKKKKPSACDRKEKESRGENLRICCIFLVVSSVTNNTNIKEISACAHVASTTSLATGNKKKLHQRSHLGYC